MDKICLDGEKIVVGVRQTLRALNDDNTEKVFIAADASEYVTEKIYKALEQKGLKAYRVKSMKSLGSSCGINRPAAAAANIKK